MRKGLACMVAWSLMASLVYPATAGAESVQGQAEVGNVQAKSLHFSVPYTDLTGHWSQSAVTRLQDLNLLKGYTDGTFKPSQVISRAEFVMILDRAFGFTGNAATGPYVDMTSDDWYYDVMVRANGSDIIEGTDREHLSPQQPITRQDAAVMVDRAFQLSAATNEDSEQLKFQDADEISGYAKKALTYLVDENILKGFQGKLNPKAPITRAETATMLSAMIADVKSAPGIYESRVDGNLIINSTDVTLKNMIVNGNLLLAEGIGEGSVVLQGVTVTGSVIIKGGGSHSININNSKLNRVVVDKRGEPVRISITEESNIQEMHVKQKSILEISSNSLIDSMNIHAEASQTQVDTKGTIQKLSVDADDVVINGEKVKQGLRTSMVGEAQQPVSSQPGGSTNVTSTSTPSSPDGQSPSTPSTPSNPAGEKPVPATTIPHDQWELVWNDEFNGPAIDSSKWTVQDTGLVYNNEMQYYSPDNTRITKDQNRSVLQIEAKKGPKNGKDYSSGKLISMGKGDWTYGKVVVRAKLPIEKGMWPAIWMMPTDEAHYGGWPASGEIDIMELIGGKESNNKVYSTLHYDSVKPDGSHGHDQGSLTLQKGETFADDYHDFQVEWLPGMIRFYVDGKLHHEVTNWQTKAAGQPEYYTFPAPFDRPFYLILNLAVGGDWPGAPESNFTSEKMNVDFVRVYSYKNLDTWPDVTTNPIEPAQQRDPQADGNQIYNDRFSEGSADNGVPLQWKFITNADGAGSVKVVTDEQKGKAAEVTIDASGTENYSVQLTQMPMYIKKNKKYKIQFDAKASADRTIMSKVNQFEKSWTNYSGDNTFALTTDWQSYDYTFNMRDGTDNNARFEFNLGLDDTTVWFANVRLIEVGEADPLTVERNALPDGNFIYNGTFDQGKERLGFWSSSIQDSAAANISVNNFSKFPIMERQLVVDVTQTNGDPQQVSVNQPDLKLEANTTYGFSLDAKADTPRSIDIDVVSSNGHTVQVHQGQNLSLNQEMKTFTGEIIIGDGASIAQSELRLLFGSSKGKVYVDNVRLTKRGKPLSVNGYAHVPATEAWMMQGLQLEDSVEGGKHVSYMDQGDLLQYKIDVAHDGVYVLSARMASGKSDSKVQFSIQDEQGTTVAQSDLSLGDTGGWQAYQTVYFPGVNLTAGKPYYVNFEGADYNTRWVDISQNKIQNSELTADLNHWELTPNDLTASHDEGAGLTIHLPGTSEHWWDALLQQGQVKLDANKTYRLTFEASASSPKSMQAVLSQNAGDFVKYFEEEVELTADQKSYTYTFTMGDTSDSAAMLAFGLGYPLSTGEHSIHIKNVQLYEVNPNADQGGQPAHVNLIPNGDFSKGEEGWFTHADGNAADLEMQVNNQQLQAKIGDAGQHPWDRQVINEGFGIQQGFKYKLTFKAKAEKSRKLGLGIGWVDAAANYEWHGFFGARVDLTPEKQEFTFTFDATEDSYANTRISFDLGNIDGVQDGNTTVSLSEVSLINLGPAN
ncbi:carbohydrate binding domain-containing protein [Paenibacillus xylanexedens]|uniref:carbohydrate binding domain-containing protein n=1 Tax=Paenibacillus xylanexedens TaxID=528191 RepID=UPI001C8E0CD3|nr:carbohydrate binding domain-containing protein [Paenibacillus xylanexedens]MBY0116809.1 carbohydrate binding domain-containing protein [Paenibacillus xylanexedens]